MWVIDYDTHHNHTRGQSHRSLVAAVRLPARTLVRLARPGRLGGADASSRSRMLHSATRKQNMTTSIADRLAFYEATKPRVRSRIVSHIDALRAAVAPTWLNLIFSEDRWPLKGAK